MHNWQPNSTRFWDLGHDIATELLRLLSLELPCHLQFLALLHDETPEVAEDEQSEEQENGIVIWQENIVLAPIRTRARRT